MKGNRERYTLALCVFVYVSVSTYVSYPVAELLWALGARLMARAFDYIPLTVARAIQQCSWSGFSTTMEFSGYVTI